MTTFWSATKAFVYQFGLYWLSEVRSALTKEESSIVLLFSLCSELLDSILNLFQSSDSIQCLKLITIVAVY